MNQSVQLDDERNKLWMNHLLQGPDEAVFAAFGEQDIKRSATVKQRKEGFFSPSGSESKIAKAFSFGKSNVSENLLD